MTKRPQRPPSPTITKGNPKALTATQLLNQQTPNVSSGGSKTTLHQTLSSKPTTRQPVTRPKPYQPITPPPSFHPSPKDRPRISTNSKLRAAISKVRARLSQLRNKMPQPNYQNSTSSDKVLILKDNISQEEELPAENVPLNDSREAGTPVLKMDDISSSGAIPLTVRPPRPSLLSREPSHFVNSFSATPSEHYLPPDSQQYLPPPPQNSLSYGEVPVTPSKLYLPTEEPPDTASNISVTPTERYLQPQLPTSTQTLSVDTATIHSPTAAVPSQQKDNLQVKTPTTPSKISKMTNVNKPVLNNTNTTPVDSKSPFTLTNLPSIKTDTSVINTQSLLKSRSYSDNHSLDDSIFHNSPSVTVRKNEEPKSDDVVTPTEEPSPIIPPFSPSHRLPLPTIELGTFIGAGRSLSVRVSPEELTQIYQQNRDGESERANRRRRPIYFVPPEVKDFSRRRPRKRHLRQGRIGAGSHRTIPRQSRLRRHPLRPIRFVHNRSNLNRPMNSQLPTLSLHSLHKTFLSQQNDNNNPDQNSKTQILGYTLARTHIPSLSVSSPTSSAVNYNNQLNTQHQKSQYLSTNKQSDDLDPYNLEETQQIRNGSHVEQVPNTESPETTLPQPPTETTEEFQHPIPVTLSKSVPEGE